MNGCHSENIEDNNDSSIEPNPLVTITDMGTKIDDYVASIKQMITNPGSVTESDARNRNCLLKIEELLRIVRSRKQMLIDAVQQYGIQKPELIKKFNHAKAELLTKELELEKLKSACEPNKTAAINSTVDKVAESMRSQISCALDFAYS